MRSNKGICYLFPIYRYDNGKKMFNINTDLSRELEELYKTTISEIDIFYYIYGILHSRIYRTKYSEFLKIDFPRIPFVKEYNRFDELSRLGKELSDLHLMKKQFPPTVKYEISGSNSVETPKYTDGKLYINKTQYFGNIPESIWNFHIGGYQVLDKWLKSRKKRELSVQEILHFIQIVEVLKETSRIMDEIDKIDFLPE